MSDLAELYRFRFSETDRARKRKVWEVLCRHFFQDYVKPTDTILDIASGYGEFSTYISAGRKIAVDLNPEARDYLPPDVEFHLMSAEDLSPIQTASVDVCFSSNFFEHLPSREVMERVLSESLRILRPGGIYVAMQPNIRYAPGEYWDYFDHIIPLTHLSCAEAFAQAGFEIRELIDRFLPFTTSSRLPKHPFLVRAYLAFRPAWRVLGRQFLIVGQKPESDLLEDRMSL